MLSNPNGAARADAMGIEYFDRLYSYALVLTRNQAEAEDLVLETYGRAMEAIGRLPAGSNLKGWLFTILRSVWIKKLRQWRNAAQMAAIKEGNRVADSISEPSNDSHDLYVLANSLLSDEPLQQETEQIRAAIQKLPVEYREIILLREYEDLSYLEIASVLECPVVTVMSRLWNARTKLRALLAARLTGSDAS
jgi:RNA polymerase sigma-70 factor (ECF subfamily)